MRCESQVKQLRPAQTTEIGSTAAQGWSCPNQIKRQMWHCSHYFKRLELFQTTHTVSNDSNWFRKSRGRGVADRSVTRLSSRQVRSPANASWCSV